MLQVSEDLEECHPLITLNLNQLPEFSGLSRNRLIGMNLAASHVHAESRFIGLYN